MVVFFDGPGSFEKLTYYLDHREAINKRHKVRRIERPVDYTFYVPDAGYSYRWEDGALIPGSYFAKREERLEARRADRLQLEEG